MPDDPQSDPQPSRARRWARLGLRGVLIGTGEPAPPARSAHNKSQAKQLTGRLAGLSLPRQVWVLSLWPLLEQLLNFLVGTVDIAIAGRLPSAAERLAATDAITVGAYFTWLMTLLQAAVGVGASAIVSRAIGASHRRLANAGVGQALLLGVASGVLAGGAVLAAAPWIAHGLGLEGDAAAMAVTYIRITAISIPMCGALFVGGACLRAAGDTKSPFLAMLLVNILNIGISVCLAGVSYGSADAPHTFGVGLGVAGIAAGTAIAWTFGGFLILAILLSGKSDIRLRKHRLLPHPHMMRRIIRIALPNLASQLGFWSINFVLLFYVSLLNIDGAFGAHMIAIRVESIAFLPGFAIAVAASTLTGQYLGLGDPDRARQATYWSAGAAVALMSFCSLFFFFTPEPLVKLLSPSTPIHLELAPPLLKIAAPVMPMFAVCIIIGSSMQGAGDTKATAVINFSGLLTTRLIGAYVLAFPLGFGLRGIWIGMMADLAIRGLLFLAYYRTGRWAHAKV
ncbi:MAG: MATE family efflux transporter [Phycisphaerales bacterium JB063]